MRLMRLAITTVFVLGAAGCAAPHRNGAAARMADWNTDHPEAARELCAWSNTHPAAAQRLFEWEGSHEEKAHEFVDWAVRHPHQGIDAFASEHPRWSDFDFITETHRPAANAFLAWCRRHPDAAQALMNRPGALKWAARHEAC